MATIPTVMELQLKLDRKQHERFKTFQELESKFTLQKLEKQKIADLTWKELVEKLQSRNLTATKVVEAFVAKALELNKRINCVTECIPDAMKWAKEIDTTHSLKSSMHGLPFAVKDNFDVQGMDSTSGLCKNLYKPAKVHAPLLQLLLDLGAVAICKTNVAQCLYSYGCDSVIFGKTLNPQRESLSSGGSSGGSGAIVGGGGVPFAIASDLGGSLRVPAHFCGVVALKPTIGRLSDSGIRKCLPKMIGMSGVPGFIAVNASLLSMLHKEVLTDNRQVRLDPTVIPIPWNQQMFSSSGRLRIAYFTNLPFFPCIGDTPNVVLSAAQTLRSLGHSVIPLENSVPDSYDVVRIVQALMWADGGNYFRQLMKDEPLVNGLKPLANILLGSDSRGVELQSNSESSSFNSKRFRHIQVSSQAALQSCDLWDIEHQRQAMAQKLLKTMHDDGIDLILCPAFPFPAISEEHMNLMYPIVFTVIWNLLDFPAGVLPFGVETGNLIETFDDEEDDMLKLAKSSVKSSVGLPISVQLVGKPFHEEMVLRLMLELEKCAGVV